MTFTLHVDAGRWRRHIDTTIAEYAAAGCAILPVVKGNGYGFGSELLVRECNRLPIRGVAVGTVHEVEALIPQIAGDCVVLEPFIPSDTAALAVWQRVLSLYSTRIVVTVASDCLAAASAAGATRARVEVATSLHRFGVQAHELDHVLSTAPDGVRVEGLTLHLPIAEPEIRNVAVLESPGQRTGATGWLLEALGCAALMSSIAREHGVTPTFSVSHLNVDDARRLRNFAPQAAIEVRLGTNLWLGEPTALRVTGTVLAIHDAGLGHMKVGYTQVDSHGHSKFVVVSGGTAHGVAIAAPITATSTRRKATAIAEGFAQAAGRVRSPFTVADRPMAFVEPPHMQVSMLWSEEHSLAVGDEVECRVRHTLAKFDHIVGLN